MTYCPLSKITDMWIKCKYFNQNMLINSMIVYQIIIASDYTLLVIIVYL